MVCINSVERRIEKTETGIDRLTRSQLQNRRYDNSVDWWTLGILLYEMVVGYTPFGGNVTGDESSKLKANFLNILTAKVRYPEEIEISAELKSLVGDLLQRDPQKRIGHNDHGVSDFA